MTLELKLADISATKSQHAGQVTALALVGRQLLTAGEDGRILTYTNLPDGPIKTQAPDLFAGRSIRCLDAMSMKEGRKLITAACSGHPDLFVWTVTPGEAAPATDCLKGEPGDMEMRCVSLSGPLALTSSGRRADIWELRGRKKVRDLPHPDEVLSAAFLPDNNRGLLATGCRDGTFRIWDMLAGGQKPAASCSIQGCGSSAPWAVAPRGAPAYMAIGGEQGNREVRVYDARRDGGGAMPAARFTLPTACSALDFAFEAKYLTCACENGVLVVVHLETLEAKEYAILGGSSDNLTSLRGCVWESEVPEHLLAFTHKNQWGLARLRKVEQSEDTEQVV